MAEEALGTISAPTSASEPLRGNGCVQTLAALVVRTLEVKVLSAFQLVFLEYHGSVGYRVRAGLGYLL